MTGVDAEARLMQRVKHGDEAALRDLYDALARNVYALALRMTDSKEDAEEVLQDTFVTAYRTADRFDPRRGSVRAWLYTIARNGCRMRLRAQASRPRADGAIGPDRLASGAGGPQGPDGAVDRLTVEQAFATLSDAEARLLEAAFFAGLSHAEIAARDGVPLGTVKSRIRRAMLKARDALGGRGAAPDGDEEAAS